MTDALIGVVGAYGAVGRAVVQQMRARSHGSRFRLAGRREERLRQIVREELAGEGEVHVLDLADTSSLKRFCAGCRIVINCAGPSHRIPDGARVAIASATDYVDPAGDERLVARLGEFTGNGRSAVVAAGMLPGLSGLLPRWLAHDFDSCDRLTAYLGVLDRFTPGAAEDYVAGLDGSESLSAWENGSRVSHATTRLVNVELPFFQSRVTAHPYLTTEGERVARRLGLRHARWYNVFEGERLLAALGRIAGRRLEGPELAAAARDLIRAAELDVAGRTPHQTLLFELDGERRGAACTRSVMLKSGNAGELTGMIAALAAQAVLDGQIVPGAHFAAQALDPGTVVQRLREQPGAVRMEILEGALSGESIIEEGAL